MRERRFDEDRVGDGTPVGGAPRSVAEQLVAYDPVVVERNVRELKSSRDIADGVDIRGGRVQVLVYLDGSAAVGFDSGRREVQSGGRGLAPRGEQDGVGFDAVTFASQRVGDRDGRTVGRLVYGFDFGVQAEPDAFLFQRFAHVLRNVAVFAGNQLGEPFEYGDL